MTTAALPITTPPAAGTTHRVITGQRPVITNRAPATISHRVRCTGPIRAMVGADTPVQATGATTRGAITIGVVMADGATMTEATTAGVAVVIEPWFPAVASGTGGQ